MRSCVLLSAVVLVALTEVALAWYIPGVSPVSYLKGDDLFIKVNSLTSTQNVMPFSFYSVKACKPTQQRIDLERKRENVGEILAGDQIEPSMFRAEMLVNSTCRILCPTLQFDQKEMTLLSERINQGYKGNMVLDNLPLAQQLRPLPNLPKVSIGYPLGLPKSQTANKKSTVIYNHLSFTIGYHRPELQTLSEDAFRIVSFFVTPSSVKHPNEAACADNAPFNPESFPLQTDEDMNVLYTYSVTWKEEPDILWATRWDVYLDGADTDARVHWFSIINSLLVVLFMSGMVAAIMMRALHKDFNRYNDPTNEDQAQEETGWKLVHGDVFRCPRKATFLFINVATGSQLFFVSIFTLVAACLGFLSPSRRGHLLSTIILIFVLLGGFAGYVAARLLKMMKLQSWAKIFMCGFYFPGTMFTIYLTLNFIQWGKHATTAIPFKTLMLLMALWIFVALTLCVLGAAIGFRAGAIEFPCSTNPVPRLIPVQRWYLRPEITVTLGSILPFGAAFIELVFIFSSFWQGRVYYVFGFLAAVFLIICITCAEISIVMTYLQLCYEDYNWWMRSFLVSGCSGCHLFLFATYYYNTALNIQTLSATFLYFGYTLMFSLVFGLVAGTVGFFASFWFTRKIYGAIKID